MSKIIVYSNPGFLGRTAVFQQDVRDLQVHQFNNDIASMKVIGEPWVAYYEKNFAGNQRVFEAGEYATLDADKDKFSSLKIVTDDLDDPEITLFEDINYQGRSVILHQETNLPDITFADKASSHKVKRGVWVLYEGNNRKGLQHVYFPGSEVPTYVPLNITNKISSARPLLPRP